MKRIRIGPMSVFLVMALALYAHAETPASVQNGLVANGGDPIENEHHRIAGTVGQPVVGVVSGLSHMHRIGFWYVLEEVLPLVSPEAAVGEEDQPELLPASYALFQNWPNPFNPLTIISYDLPEVSEALLTIHTIAGQKVAVLVDRRQEAGRQAVLFDGTGFANGVYIYRLQIGQFGQARRMLLLK